MVHQLKSGQPALIPKQHCPECGSEISHALAEFTPISNFVEVRPCGCRVTLEISPTQIRVIPYNSSIKV